MRLEKATGLLVGALVLGWSGVGGWGQVHAQTADERVRELIEQASLRLGQTAPDARRFDLTVEEAVARALDRNLDIAVQRLVPQVFDLNLAEQLAFYRPTLASNFSSTSSTTPSSTQLDGGLNVLTDTSLFDSSIAQPVPWGGGQFDLSWNNTRRETTNFFSSFNPSYRSAVAANYTQPLLRGFGIDPARQQLAVTRVNRDISDVDLRETVTNTLSGVRDAYWELVYTVQTVAVQRQALELPSSSFATTARASRSEPSPPSTSSRPSRRRRPGARRSRRPNRTARRRRSTSSA